MDDSETWIIRIQGVPVRVPDQMFTQSNTSPRPLCEAVEPDWPDNSGGQVRCCLPVHETGPAGMAHIANNAGWPTGDIIAIWWDAPAMPGDNDVNR